MKHLTTAILGFFLLISTACCAEVKYIFYFIGDGMGPNEVLATEMYLAELNGKIGREKLCMTQFPAGGMLSTYSASNGVTDSSAAGTALACGQKAKNSTLGINAAGDTLTSIAEILHERGWAVGITTSVSIDHATPASFYANSNDRNDYYGVAVQLAQSDFEFFGGSAIKYPRDRSKKAPSVYGMLREKGYTIARGYDDYQAKKGEAKKIMLVNYNEAADDDARGSGMLPYALESSEQDIKLDQITTAAIDFLSQYDRFFLMTEGGAIDWAGHADDGRAVIEEVRAFDKSIQVAYDFYLQHPDETLIVVTADHETGGLVIGNGKYDLNLQVLQHQKVSVGTLSDRISKLRKEKGEALTWDEVKALLRESLGFYDKVEITPEEDATLQAIFAKTMAGNTGDVKTLYKTLGELANKAVQILNDKSVLAWTSGSHSATPVPLFAVGVGAERFSGWHDNTEIVPLMLQLVE